MKQAGAEDSCSTGVADLWVTGFKQSLHAKDMRKSTRVLNRRLLSFTQH